MKSLHSKNIFLHIYKILHLLILFHQSALGMLNDNQKCFNNINIKQEYFHNKEKYIYIKRMTEHCTKMRMKGKKNQNMME